MRTGSSGTPAAAITGTLPAITRLRPPAPPACPEPAEPGHPRFKLSSSSSNSIIPLWTCSLCLLDPAMPVRTLLMKMKMMMMTLRTPAVGPWSHRHLPPCAELWDSHGHLSEFSYHSFSNHSFFRKTRDR